MSHSRLSFIAPSIGLGCAIILCLCSGGAVPTAKSTLSNKPSATTVATVPSVKSVKPSTIMHNAFKEAGKKAGIQIWRIENFEPVPYPVKDYGKFFTGDSFILLKTKEQGGIFSWDIHFWLGSETSQDEAGTAAILSVELDDGLGGAPVQYREVQDHESELFLSYFPSGIRYMPGGVASGFHHTEINAAGEKKLYQVKGKRNIRVTLVSPNVKSMNNGDCYILDKGSEIFVYVGTKAKSTERLKATTAANQIRDQDNNGRSHINVVDSSSSPEEIEQFFKELGSGSAKDVAPAAATDDDEAFEKKEDTAVALYKVSDASGKLSVQKIEAKQLSKTLLKTDDCFILDTSTSGIYVWVGKKGTTQEKIESIKHAQEFLKKNNYPAWTRVTRVVEGGEPTAFKQYFQEWRDAATIAGLG